MAQGTAEGVLRHIHKLVGRSNDSQATDRELLRRFTVRQDETAFEVLFRRHGAMVLAAAKRVLGNAHDAEDVCQAAFLLLAKKAASQRWQPSVASWLYTTAHQLALKARTAAHRRARREGRAAPRARPNPLAEITGHELLAVLDEELRTLPEPLRAPLVLCYLEGATRDEAAQRLGCPLATLKNRLERGRDQLHAALVRRGLGLSAVLLGTLLTQQSASAAATLGLARQTARAALAQAAGQPLDGVVSSQVSRLVNGGLGILGWTRFKAALALLLVGGLLATAAALAYIVWDDRPVGTPPGKVPAPQDRNAKRLAAAPVRAQRTTLRYQFKVGDKVRYVVEKEMETTTTAAGNERTVTTTQTYDMTWKVTTVDTDGKATLTQTIDRIRFVMDSGLPGKIEFDSRKHKNPKGIGSQILAPGLKVLAGSRFTCTVSPRGEISNFKVPKKVLDAVKKMRGGRALFSPESFQQLVSQASFVLPTGPVRQGGSWNQKADSKMAGPARMTVDARATYQGKADQGGKKLDKIILTLTAKVAGAGGGLGQFTLKNQDGKGTIFFDNARGRLVESQAGQDLHLEFNPGAQAIVVDVKIRQSAKLIAPKGR
jgi:RNA polymerase sigma factor (sigma-70 family)